MNAQYSKAYTADVDIAPYLICKAGSADGFATIAAASTDPILGVSDNANVAAGQEVDIIRDGQALVTAGGTIAAGDFLTSNGTGQAITAAPATGVNANIVGQADVSAVAGDVFPITIVLGKVQG